MKKLVLSFALPLLFLASCSTEEKKPTGENNAVKTATPAMNTKLAAADAQDGKTDKVVHNCAGCSLGMAGSADHSLKVGEYDMHFCKDACLAKFKGSTEKEVLALTIPEKK